MWRFVKSLKLPRSVVKGRLWFFFLFFIQIRVEKLRASKKPRASVLHRKKAPYSRSLFFSRQSFIMFKFMLTGFTRNYFVLCNSRHSKELSQKIVLKEERKCEQFEEEDWAKQIKIYITSFLRRLYMPANASNHCNPFERREYSIAT